MHTMLKPVLIPDSLQAIKLKYDNKVFLEPICQQTCKNSEFFSLDVLRYNIKSVN